MRTCKLEKRKIIKDDCTQIVCCCLGAKKIVRKWVCKSFFRFLIRTDSGPFLILENDVWVRVGNTNNSTVLDFFKSFMKSCFAFFVFSGKKIMPKVTFRYQNAAFRAQNRFFQLQSKINGLEPLKASQRPGTTPNRISATSCIQNVCSKLLKPSFENLKSRNGS